MKTPQKPSRQAGWNLIELMVVVSIITILLAILINTAVEGKGPAEQTKVTLRTAMAIGTEYEVTTTLKINHLDPNLAGGTSIAKFCSAVWKLDRTRTMLMSLGKDAVKSAAGAAPTTILDGWGRGILYYSGEGTPDAGMPKSKDPYLGSAGPDGKWGTFNATTNVPDADAKDNLYSSQLD